MSESQIFYFFLKANKLSYLNNKNTFKPLYYSVKDSVINYNTAELPSFEFETPPSEFESASIPETEIEKPLDSIYKVITKTLNPNEEIQLQILFNDFDRNEVEPYGGLGIEFDYTLKKMQIAYTSDSTFVKQNISKELLDSLRKNNIKIFHGTIYSNKVPLKFEE
ncbi:hypothetical protein [Moheibacter lacus]|nr:hypothetical protein [Moheibacter lacus]